MIKIAICDDDINIVSKYANMINDISNKNHIEIELSYFYSGESLLAYCTGATDILDIVYLDIIMDQTNGMDTARMLQEIGCQPLIVFLTGYDEYVFEAFDVNAVHYLLKNTLSPEKFEKVFLTAVDLAVSKEKQIFSYVFDGKTMVVALDEVSYFSIWNKQVTIHYSHKKTDTYYDSMERLEKQLEQKGFIRIHRSYLVHMPYILMFKKNGIALKTGEVLPIGGTYRNSIKTALSEYISCHTLSHFENPNQEVTQ